MEIRNDLKNWKEYIPAKSAESISLEQKRTIEKIDKLDSGESVFGPSPYVLRELSRFKGYQFYPDPTCRELRKEIGRYCNISSDSVLVTNGADELIDILLRLVLNVGDEVIDCPPTFGMYSVYTTLNRGVVKTIKRKSDFSLDTDLIIKSINGKTKILFICSPNNPTGNSTPLSEIEKVLKTGILVCIDEAYGEFAGASSISLLKKYENLVIIRSFSKWAGIAGLRLGYGIMSEVLVKQLLKIKPPYNVNYAAVIAGIASLRDENYRRKTITSVIQERKKLEEAIKKLKKYKVFQSNGNFIFIQTSKKRLERIKKECGVQKVFLKLYESEIVGFAIRITIGKPYQNKKIFTILEKSI